MKIGVLNMLPSSLKKCSTTLIAFSRFHLTQFMQKIILSFISLVFNKILLFSVSAYWGN